VRVFERTNSLAPGDRLARQYNKEDIGEMKLVAAFLAGLIVACFAALIYVKSTHPAATLAQTQAASSAPAAPQEDAAKAEPPPEPPAPATDDTEPAQPVVSPKPAVKPAHHEAHPHAKRVEPPVEVAQNQGPAEPTPPAPAPPVPDSTQPAVTPQAQQPAEPAPSPSPTPDSAPPPPPPAVRQPMTVTLAAGMPLPIRVAETLSTDHNYTGDTFRATLDQPIIMNGYIIADKGSKVLGHIIEADRPARVNGPGQLILALSEINTTDGQRVTIHTENWTKQAPNSHARDAEEIGGGAALGAIIGAIAGGGKGAAIGAGAGGAAGTAVDMSTRGKPAVVPVETHLTFHLQNPVTITEKLN